MDALNRDDIPLYLDTSVLWRVKDITALRERFPEREFCVPTIAHFERLRQLREDHGADFDMGVIRDVIETLDLILQDFDRVAAQWVAQMAVRLEGEGLRWRPVPLDDVRRQPCGQRCRLGDYAIAATAKAGGGLLLTDDKELRAACQRHPDIFPAAMSLAEAIQRLAAVGDNL